MGDWNVYSQSLDEAREEEVRAKIMEEWIVDVGWTVIEEDSSPI